MEQQQSFLESLALEMNITKDTKICISIAEAPGNFGATVFNAGFKALDLDFVYKPFRVADNALTGAVAGIRSFDIKGCGVSMPHKVKIIPLLDQIEGIAKKIGAVNTVVNKNGALIGYNTDFEGVRLSLGKAYDVSGKKVLIIGAGGAARAAANVLKDLGVGRIVISNRDDERGKKVADELAGDYLFYGEKHFFRGDLLINATPAEEVVSEGMLANYEAVMDFVVSFKPTLLIDMAIKRGKVVITGLEIAVHQAAGQFFLYTGCQAPLEVMIESANKLLNHE